MKLEIPSNVYGVWFWLWAYKTWRIRFRVVSRVVRHGHNIKGTFTLHPNFYRNIRDFFEKYALAQQEPPKR